MQKNWYAIYTKPQCEKKIAALFSRWKIENVCPLNYVKTNVSWSHKLHYKPLFTSYVFVRISSDQIERLRKVEGVVNFLHWLGKPAIIKEEEIQAMKEFTNNYQDIKLERTKVNINDSVRVIDDPSYRIEGKFISVKSKFLKVTLPSMGYTLVAQMEKQSILERHNSFLENISTNNYLNNQINTA